MRSVALSDGSATAAMHLLAPPYVADVGCDAKLGGALDAEAAE